MAPTIEAEGRYFDGLSARPHPVRLHLDARLWVTGRGIAKDWDPLDLRAADSVPPLMRVGPAHAPDRVEFSDVALAAALAERCPDLRRREGAGGVRRLLLWSAVAGISVLLVASFGVPYLARLLVPLVPDSVEARLGAVVEPQVLRLLGQPPACAEGPGRAALDRLVARLVAARGPDGSLPSDLTVTARRHEMANALALPGARVILLSGLIARAKTPDEVAAVLAHELGHVGARDPTRSLIRASGTSFLLSVVLGDLTGSTVIVAVGEAALSAGYSRDAERAADAYAVDLMTRAGGNGAALADILERIAADDGGRGPLDLLRSHPLTAKRAAAIRALAGPNAPGRQILPASEWSALKGICGTNRTPDESRTP
ncbi:M48 family metallopeptidase [Methylobacterium tarhaniae]|uniref:M48 family metallopeptidase n=1 Tax=Methylobacterium tarhaniae TaxID=1187852 RepID=UPI000ABB977F|nr:M48 family metallopeptidase [Methylobacterium tarhaniae]